MIKDAIYELQEYIGNGEYNWDNASISLNSAMLAIKALQKEIEKSVVKNLVGENDLCSIIQNIGDIKSIQCPCCSRTLKHSKGKLTGRCPNCGQKLRWNDEYKLC